MLGREAGSTAGCAATGLRWRPRSSPLTASRNGLSNATLLEQSQGWLDAFCLGGSGSRYGACESLDNHFSSAIKHFGGNRNAARNALDALIFRAKTARDHGDPATLGRRGRGQSGDFRVQFQLQLPPIALAEDCQ